MRTTMHNGRSKRGSGKGYSARHNDRNYDTSKADNIDQAKSQGNQYRHCYGGEEMTFAEAELRFYEEHFGQQLKETNERYIRNRHPERCKTMEQWKQLRQNAPEETVIQIGKMEEHVDRAVLVECYNDYNKRLQQWNNEHGKPFSLLSQALHVDEAVPHVQTRRVWHYRDSSGTLRIGQEKALAAAGVPLPNPDKPEGRHNHRKLTFDKMARELWLDVCKEHGLDLEREPVPNGRHNREKEEMIRDKYEVMLDEIDRAETVINTANDLKNDLERLKVEKRVYTAAEAAEASKTAKSGLLNKSTVKVPKEQFEALVRTAGAAEEAIKAAGEMAAGLQEAREEADDLIAAARVEATEILEDAKTQSMEKYIDQIRKEKRLEELRILEEKFPEVFRQMREQTRNQDRDRGYGRSR